MTPLGRPRREPAPGVDLGLAEQAKIFALVVVVAVGFYLNDEETCKDEKCWGDRHSRPRAGHFTTAASRGGLLQMNSGLGLE